MSVFRRRLPSAQRLAAGYLVGQMNEQVSHLHAIWAEETRKGVSCMEVCPDLYLLSARLRPADLRLRERDV